MVLTEREVRLQQECERLSHRERFHCPECELLWMVHGHSPRQFFYPRWDKGEPLEERYWCTCGYLFPFP